MKKVTVVAIQTSLIYSDFKGVFVKKKKYRITYEGFYKKDSLGRTIN